MKQFRTFVIKEFLHVFRDPKTMLMLFGLPIAQILLFGFALTNEIKNSHIAIVDHDHSLSSQQIIDKIAASDQFILDRLPSEDRDILSVFREGETHVAMVIPADFEAQLLHGSRPQLQVIADASDPNLATTLTTYLSRIVADFQSSSRGAQKPAIMIDPQLRMLYNPELKGATNFVPGVMTLVLLLVCALMTSVSIVREKELGTMEVLLVSPMHPLLFILSKAVPYFILSMVNLTVILAMSVFLLGLSIHGSLLLLYFVSAIFILCALSLGLLISNSTESQQTAMLISLMAMLIPTVLLTGFMFPVENMPLALQYVSRLIPSHWFYIIVKNVMIKGLGLSMVWRETAVLMGMTLVLLLLSLRRFKIRLQ